MSIHKAIIVLFIVFNFGVVKAQDNYVVAFGKLKVEWGSTDNTKITLYEDGKEIDSYRPEKNGKFQFTLELNHMYMFWFEKSGHVTKKVQFNTAVPEAVTSDPEFIPFPDFDFFVTLFKSYPEVDTMFFTKPVGKIQYNAQKNDFDWDKNYTLEIQRRMEEIEEDIRKKHEDNLRQEEQEAELAKQQEFEAEEAKKEAKRQEQIEKERQEKEAKRLADIEQERKKQEERERAESQKEASELQKQKEKEAERLAAIEEEKRKQEKKDREKAELEAEKQAAIDAKNAEKEKEEQDRLALKAQNERKLDSDSKEESTEQIKPLPENEEFKSTETVEKLVNKTKQPSPIVAEQYKPNKKPTYGTSVVKKQKPSVKQVNKVEIAGKTTTKTSITENDVTLIYVKVKYTWGGRFFFIEDEPGVFRNISEQYYNRKVKNK